MNGKAAVFIFAVLFAVTTALSDQDYWIQRSKENANRDLDQWCNAVGALGNNNATLADEQLEIFKLQFIDGVRNMEGLLQKLLFIVGKIKSITGRDPNSADREELLTFLLQIYGLRDNKSYYLFDGNVMWIGNRINALKAGGRRAKKLASKLLKALKYVRNLRDELDANAQNYVQNMAKIQGLKDDYYANYEEIYITASALWADLETSELLQNAKAAEKIVTSVVA